MRLFSRLIIPAGPTSPKRREGLEPFVKRLAFEIHIIN